MYLLPYLHFCISTVLFNNVMSNFACRRLAKHFATNGNQKILIEFFANGIRFLTFNYT